MGKAVEKVYILSVEHDSLNALLGVFHKPKRARTYLESILDIPSTKGKWQKTDENVYARNLVINGLTYSIDEWLVH